MSIIDIEKYNVSLKNKLDSQGLQYAYIGHINENGKTPHYHIVIKTGSSRKRVSTMLYFLSDLLGFDYNCISIQPCFNIIGSIQYLTHKNNTDKQQYNYDDIVSNMQDLYVYYNQDINANNITTEYLIQLARSNLTDLELMLKLGVNNYNHYINNILTIKKALYSDIKHNCNYYNNVINDYLTKK